MNLSASAFCRLGMGLLVVAGLLSQGGCEKRRPAPGGVVRIGKKNPVEVKKPEPPRGPGDPDERYDEVIRPTLIRLSCSTTPCHGAERGGGFTIYSPDKRDQRTYKRTLEYIDREHPEKSPLLVKPTRQVAHGGGMVFTRQSCDYQRILAWISNAPDPQCSDAAKPDPQRFAREVAPALAAMGCTDCHAKNESARRAFDLSSLARATPNYELAQVQIQATQPTRLFTSMSKMIVAANGDAHHPQKFDRRSCAYRRVYGYLSGAPELHCELDTPDKPNKSAEAMPDFNVFVEKVLPAIGKRGCFDGSCHASGAGGMSLFRIEDDRTGGWHDYLNLTARVEDFAHPEKSTLITTARNEEPHGGGERLGGTGDCVDEVLMGWLRKKPPNPCQAPPIPTYARFVQEIQPVLDKMTCTQKKCHGESLPQFVIKRHPATEAIMAANYKAVLKEIDLEFMPFSGIQLRMREPCAYSVVAAWIQSKPKPVCVVHDPAPGVFPKMEADIKEKAAAHDQVEGQPPI